MREKVKNLIGEEHLVPIIGCYNNVNDIDIDKLPDSFVLKPNHASGFIIMIPSKKDLNEEDIRRIKKKLSTWMKIDYYKWGKSYEYKGIKRKILCEAYLENTIEKPLLDYKVHCFSGEPQLVQVDFDRFSNHTRKFYDLNWHAMPFSTLYPISMKDATKPDKFEEMLLFARQLSRDMVYARIDFYVYKGIIYFGEVTLDHRGGFEPF